MKILVIGGTIFVGKAIVEVAIEQGHEVVLFNRGKTNPERFSNLRTIVGDRDGGLDVLGDEKWDAVIDTCGYTPGIVQQSVDYFKDKTDRYLFISTISVYDLDGQAGVDEAGPLLRLENESQDEVNAETYGGLKVLSENVLIENLPTAALIVRPGLIVGPYDPTNRFTYWVQRIAEGGDILVPPDMGQLTQFIDVRDLADFCIHLLEQRKVGIFNAVGPEGQLALGSLFDTMRKQLNPKSYFLQVDGECLESLGIMPWSGLPLWLPEGEAQSLSMISNQKGMQNGLRFRSLADTIQATWEWAQANPNDKPRMGISREKEQEALKTCKRI